MAVPARLELSDRVPVVLRKDVKLYAHHIGGGPDTGVREQPVAELAQHPTDGRWGLRNLTDRQWFGRSPEGQSVVVDPGRSIDLKPGVEIGFGATTGRILAPLR
jgi:hypothetical protein